MEKLKAEAEERGWTGQRAKASEGNGGGGRGRVVDGRGRAGTGGDDGNDGNDGNGGGDGDGDGGGQRWAVVGSGGQWTVDSGQWTAVGGGSRKNKKCTIQKRPRNRFRSLLSSVFRPSGAASGILPYSAGCSAGVSAGACAGISAWGIVAGASVSRTRS